MQFVNLTDEQRKQIAAEQVSKNIQPMPMEKGLQTEILPFSLNPLKLFGGVASNAAADVAGADRDYRADISNAKNTDEIKSAVNNAISKFDNANPLIFGGDDLKKQKSEFLKNVSNSIRQSKLADGLSEYNGNLYLRKGDELFDLDDGLIKQIGRVMRDNVGSMAGAALGYKKGGGFFQNMAGSALGAAGGSSIDHLNNSNYAGQEANAANALKKMGEEALFSVAGDALIGAAAKYGKPTLNLAGKVADKMPLLNLGKQAVESVPTANVKGAMKSAEAIAGDEAEAMLKNAAEVGGYKVDGGNITDLQLLNPIINKAKDFSARAAQKLRLDDAAAAINNTRGLDAEREKILNLALSDRKSAERLLNALRGDKSGRGARNLADLAQSDVSRLREIIGQSETTDLKDVVEQYYKATKDDFGQAIDNLDAFKNGQKIRLSDDAIEQMKDEVSSNLNIFDKSSDKTRGVMEGFDSLKGRELGVKELNELRANYNKGLNDILNSDKNSYATKINFIKGKEILERAMDDLLGDDAARAYLRENLQKYKDFKGFERSPLFKAITNIESSAQDVMNAFRGLRDAQGGLYDKFISKLSPEQAQKFELAAIKDDFEGALGKTGTFNVREILNGKELNDALKKTNFRSEKAKEIVREIDKLAKARGNLAEIFAALDSKFIMPTRFNKGIATTFEGASKTAFVNAVRQTALKYVPIIGNDAALEYHLREAAKAIKSGGTLKDYVKTMEKNGASKEQAKAFTDFIKETAEQGSKLEQAGAKQVVEKQGSGASIGGLTANSNAHLGSGMVAGTLNSVDEDGNFSPERFAAGFLAGLVGSKAAAVGLRKMTPKLYNQILGAAEKMPQMANGNPRLLGKLYSNGKDVSLNSFAGEKAITANVGKLDQAKAMLEKGADEVEIWQKTGWFKDKDGAWKFEIGDSNAKLNPNFQSGGRLDKLLEHEELFKAYPELKDVRVVKIGDETPSGAALSVKDAAQREKRGIYNVAFNNKKSTIIRKDLDAIDEIIKFEKGEADYMLHGERKSGYGALHIQKHLDTQNNGWVTKQEYLDMGQMLRKSMMEEADDKRIYTYFNDEGIRFRVVIGIGKNKERVISFYSNRKPLKAGLSYNSQNYDGNLPLNDDIIAQNGAKGYYSPAKNEIGLSDLGDKSTLIHEVQHAIQEIEDFARGGDFNTVWNVAAKNIEKRYESEIARLEKISNDAWEKYAPLQKEYIKLFDGGLKDTPEAQRLLKQMRAFSDEGYRADHEIRELRKAANAEQNAITEETLQENYRKIHGEAEARNVQNRLNLDRKAHPHETFDVNPNETIVSKEDGISYSRKIEEQRFAGTGRDKTTIMYATPHVGTGLAGGTLNAKDENGNFDAEKFAKGFIYGLFGSKITAATLKKTNPKLYDQIVKIAEGNASKEKISSFVNKLKQDELGKLLQKTVTNKDLSTKTKVEIIEAAKSRYAQEIK